MEGIVTRPATEDTGPAAFTVVTGHNGTVIVTLGDDLDIVSAPAVRERLLSLLRPDASRLVIDMSAIRYADASGLAVLVSTQRRAVLLGGTLRLAAMQPEVARVLTVTGFSRRLAAYPTVQAAIAGRKLSIRTVLLVTSQAVKVHALLAKAQAELGPDSGELRAAVAALLANADAWRDADPRRRFSPALRRPTPAPVTPPWPRQPSPCCPFSAGSRSPTRPQSPPPPAGFASCFPPGHSWPWVSEIV
jgi:anti-anti-sigma factor